MADRASLASPYRHRCIHRSTRLSRRAGQAIIEYTILLVMLASITIGVMALAGHQLGVAFNDVKYDIGHASDPRP